MADSEASESEVAHSETHSTTQEKEGKKGKRNLGNGNGQGLKGGWISTPSEGYFRWDRVPVNERRQGIVVVFGWMLSKPCNLIPYQRLYGEAGWDSLVCHPHVLNLWFPTRALTLALRILDELAKEVEARPRPIVFATFSGGAKACLYKIFQILQGSEEGGAHSTEKYANVRACVAGQMHDSSPTDFVSSLGAHFVSTVVLKSRKSGVSNVILPVMTQAVVKLLDALFLREFNEQRDDYWLTLYQSANLGPILILCSTNDDLASFDTINKFAKAVQQLGCEIECVVWDTSEHVGHLKNFPNEYQAAVKSFLNKRSANNTFRSLESSGLRGGREETTTTGIIAQSGHHRGDSIFHRSRSSQGFSIGDTSYDTQPGVQHDDARTTKNPYTSKLVSLGDNSNPLNRPLISRLSSKPSDWSEKALK